jgi:hypothetical protein
VTIVTDANRKHPHTRPIKTAQWGLRMEDIMTRNEGNVDRALRVILGLALLSLVFVGPKTAWGWVGLVPLVTGLVGFCPLYKLVGLNTCPVKLAR